MKVDHDSYCDDLLVELGMRRYCSGSRNFRFHPSHTAASGSNRYFLVYFDQLKKPQAISVSQIQIVVGSARSQTVKIWTSWPIYRGHYKSGGYT